ncbi:putative LRR receptor-like serine/threonine-protein kinase [Morus notabilis]|uniref:Putative LRR receptor-like serine/threonine-protein kinase n=1 Tax=Morus notabilis TaxID=981085 RepID=W9R7N3_9ROSA|nr:putative LRR receptor-like serine/threonine-protein kinase [Morus notabilis]
MEGIDDSNPVVKDPNASGSRNPPCHSIMKALRVVKGRLIDPNHYLRNWHKGDPCTLTGLKLDVMWNGLTGTIPKEIGKLSSLKLLLLNGNKLSGSLPDELGYLSNLNRLQVDQNQMSGPIPKSFTSLVKVKHLHMNNNSFSGQIPSELSKLPILLHLHLDNNYLSGHLPPELSNLTALSIFQLDNNNFSGSDIPATYGSFYGLVKLDLSQNHLIGPIPSEKLSDNMTTIDLRNNSLSDISGDLDPGANVSLRLENNPICQNASQQNIGPFCRSSAEKNEIPEKSKDSNATSCYIQSCPFDDFFEYVSTSSVRCYCAAPIRIGYRLKSPSFSYFRPYYNKFKVYLTRSLELDVSQLSIDSFFWESGPRLQMYLKLFPTPNSSHSNTSEVQQIRHIFNKSEVQRIRHIFISWEFPRTDFFGPYELLNFTLLGPYSDVIITNGGGSGSSKGILAAIVLGAIACIFTFSAIVFLLISRHKYRQAPSRRRRSTRNFDSSTQVGRGGYGKVYKGILGDDTIVAIKRAEEGSLQGQKEFLTEIELLSRLHHRNLVSLIWYCDEEEEQMLVYEFMPNGTLRDWLSAKAERTLNFSMRLRIALGSAKSILYLHTEAEPPIFHRDIKATNILLDSHLTAKVADFGLSRLAPPLDAEGTVPEYVSTVVKGTPVCLILLRF